jgi:NAD-dependent dihydropyrimidine dehydrogenase PreA subunit
MARQMAVVLSQGQSNNPVKRRLEETIVAELMMAGGFDVTVISHLYDLSPDSTALLALQGLSGDLILLSWLYPRAAHWTLDRHDIRGRIGETALKSAWDERKKKWEKKTQEYRTDENTPRVVDLRPEPNRTIFHLDLRITEDPRVYVDEVKRIAAELAQKVVHLAGTLDGQPRPLPDSPAAAAPSAAAADETAIRRWYPVIDYSRCTNCMECIDFCLFGVYGIDQQETILVEQPDNCRKGCPACSRVCPENAIIFPQHKTPVIAGDPSIGGEMKIDLSQLFGQPSDLDTAARERDEQLRLAGREPVGAAARQAPGGTPASPAPRDELDDLIDELDQMDL